MATSSSFLPPASVNKSLTTLSVSPTIQQSHNNAVSGSDPSSSLSSAASVPSPSHTHLSNLVGIYSSSHLQRPGFAAKKTEKSAPSPAMRNREEWKARLNRDSFVNRLNRHVDKHSLKGKIGGFDQHIDQDGFMQSRESDLESGKSARDFYKEIFVSRYTKLRRPTMENGDELVNIDDLQQECSSVPLFNQRSQTFKTSSAKEIADRLRTVKYIQEANLEPFDSEAFVEKHGENDFNKQRVLQRVLRIVFDLHLALSAFQGSINELMLRDGCLLKHCMKFRQAFLLPILDKSLAKKVHWLLIENLPPTILATYLELLQFCRHKCYAPLIDMLVVNEAGERKPVSLEIVNFVHRKPPEANILIGLLDPQSPGNSGNFQQLSRNFFFLMISPVLSLLSEKNNTQMRHETFFKKLLPLVGRGATEVKFNASNRQVLVGSVVEHMKFVLREKIIEIRRAHPNAEIVLIGWDTSCLLACKAALEFPVAALICLAFPNVTANGIRGDVDDDLLTMPCPVLFVCGQFTTSCSVDDLQDTRDIMPCETGLVLVGGADHQLRMTSKKLRMESISQDAVDCAILETVGDFLVFIYDRTVPRGINDFDKKDGLPGNRHRYPGQIIDASLGLMKRKFPPLNTLDYQRATKSQKKLHSVQTKVKGGKVLNGGMQSKQLRVGYPSKPPEGAIYVQETREMGLISPRSREGSTERHPPAKHLQKHRERQMSRSLMLVPPHGGPVMPHTQQPRIAPMHASYHGADFGKRGGGEMGQERRFPGLQGHYYQEQRFAKSRHLEAGNPSPVGKFEAQLQLNEAQGNRDEYE